MNRKGNYEQFRDAIAFRESSGDPTIENKYGYIGLYQFGEAALQDLGYYKGDSTPKKNDWIGEWTGKNGIYSKDDFLKNSEVQEKAANEWFALLWEKIQRLGLDKYVGQTVDGIEITESGLIAAAHLKGVGALKKFLEGKLKNTKDGFGMTRWKMSSRAYFLSPEASVEGFLLLGTPSRRMRRCLAIARQDKKRRLGRTM